jgi:hypothetical protein
LGVFMVRNIVWKTTRVPPLTVQHYSIKKSLFFERRVIIKK